jgi:hypothetical protein
VGAGKPQVPGTSGSLALYALTKLSAYFRVSGPPPPNSRGDPGIGCPPAPATITQLANTCCMKAAVATCFPYGCELCHARVVHLLNAFRGAEGAHRKAHDLNSAPERDKARKRVKDWQDGLGSRPEHGRFTSWGRTSAHDLPKPRASVP